MTQKFSNAARAYLASGVSDSATSITVTTGTGATFPEITSPDFARAVLQDANGIEIVLITAHAAGSDSFTVTRAQESTSARAFSAGAVFGLRVTAADAASFAAKQEYLVSGTNIKTINGTSVLGAGNIQIDGGVTSFNTRTGAVTLGSSDVTTALGYTPLSLGGGTMTGNITFAAGQTWPTFNQNTTGSAATLSTGRTIGMTGDVTWTSASFNGSANVTGTATLANSGVTAGTYTKVTVDTKGRVTSGASLASADLPTYTGTLTSSQVTTALGYTPYNSTNPNGYITSSSLSSYLALSGGTMTGQITTRTTTGATPIVNGSGSNTIQVMGDGTNGAWMSFHRSGAYAINMGMDTSNVFAVGGWSDGANYRWQVDASGNFTARGNVTAYSDERLKKDWADLPADFIERLAKVKRGTYTRIDSGERQVGVSAQGLLAVLQEAVSKDGQGNLSVAYGNAALTAAVELARRLVALETRLAALEA